MKVVADEQHIVDEISRLDGPVEERSSIVPLVEKLCNLLADEKISYCHWKSNDVLERSASGENDLDLLVSRADGARFTEILLRLGFKQAKAPDEKQIPGVLDYFGYDEEVDRLIHVHAHYQLILGHDMTKNYRLPIEKPFLQSAVESGLFKTPAAEFDLIVFVIRMVLKHSTWDVILGGEGALKRAEQRELSWLQSRANQNSVYDILQRHLPYISKELFDNCVRALQPGCGPWTRIRTGQQLQARLQANSRHSMLIDTLLKLWRRAGLAIRRRIRNSVPKYRLERGGAMIAIVGGDGAGKSTAVGELDSWLSQHFETTTVHMGKPSWSPTTVAIRGMLKLGNLLGLYPVETSLEETIKQRSRVSPGYPWLLREVCRARDRYWHYIKAQRFANNGGLVILDRFPLPQIRIMDGPLARHFIHQLMQGPASEQPLSPHRESRFAKTLVELEESYYSRVALPEFLFVLRVAPEVAVQRKPAEDASYVRERNSEIWRLDWDHTDAILIDAGRSRAEVLSELKACVWAGL